MRSFHSTSGASVTSAKVVMFSSLGVHTLKDCELEEEQLLDELLLEEQEEQLLDDTELLELELLLDELEELRQDEEQLEL